MSYPLFPASLPIGFSVRRKPVTSTRVARHASGRTVRRPLFAVPLFSFEFVAEGLSSDAAIGGIPAASFQALQGFFGDRAGQYGLFRYRDPLDNSSTNQPLGVGDGVTTLFACVWTLGSAAVPVGQVEPAGLTVSVGGGTVSGGWTIGADGASILFATPPAPGALVSASYGWTFLCAFDEDALDLEQFMANLWSARSIKFTSVKR